MNEATPDNAMQPPAAAGSDDARPQRDAVVKATVGGQKTTLGGETVGNIRCAQIGAQNRTVVLYRLSGDSSHYMNSEFEAFAVNVVGKRLESLILSCRREALRGRHKPSVFVHSVWGNPSAVGRIGARRIPEYIYDHIFPAEVSKKVSIQVVHILLHFILSNCCTESVPTVPPHCWSRSDFSLTRTIH